MMDKEDSQWAEDAIRLAKRAQEQGVAIVLVHHGERVDGVPFSGDIVVCSLTTGPEIRGLVMGVWGNDFDDE